MFMLKYPEQGYMVKANIDWMKFKPTKKAETSKNRIFVCFIQPFLKWAAGLIFFLIYDILLILLIMFYCQHLLEKDHHRQAGVEFT